MARFENELRHILLFWLDLFDLVGKEACSWNRASCPFKTDQYILFVNLFMIIGDKGGQQRVTMRREKSRIINGAELLGYYYIGLRF